MVAQPKQRLYSPEEYLVLEELATEKSEFRDGERVPMTGGSTTHNEIAGNIKEYENGEQALNLSSVDVECALEDAHEDVIFSELKR